MKNSRAKNFWVLLLLMLSGIVLGGCIAAMTQDIAFLSWLSYGQTFGLDSPVILNLGILAVTFGLTIKITMAGIIGVLAGIFIYRAL
ncbi:DUF4321 domain-containing protein [Anaerobium acetethylicum]|uniref:DUF4321 domain-containing protein n=1 Tax=Anaerobium acetethylicum TaxID=1619234 RepID=A0A1D3TNV6_9FIRM|nr:DUF4321 domain-containing protein [Anaerobium acetethylicum]SCP95043.1 protein of unknown function [Anaerobium acetethylicum]